MAKKKLRAKHGEAAIDSQPTLSQFLWANTAYRLIEQPIPHCFAHLSERYEQRAPVVHHPIMHFAAALAHGLCIRMGDIEYYAQRITDELTADRGPATAISVSSLLVGHFGSCKAVFDAGGIAVATIYELKTSKGKNLPEHERDFTRDALWNALEKQQPRVHARYAPFREVMREIADWRNAAVHRTVPFVITVLERDKQTGIHRTARYDLALDQNPSAADVFGYRDIEWGHPLHFHRRWQSTIVAFCDEVCRDLETTI